MTTTRLSLDQADLLARGALARLAFTESECTTIANHLMDCELRGLEYSGLARILSIAERIHESPSVATPIRLTRESAVSAQVNGGDQVGYIVGQEATRLAIAKASDSGIGAVGANNTWYTGMLSYYAEQIVAAGLVAMITSNATPWVAPFGGTEGRFGTNPICFGFPSDDVPLIWDIGISEVIHAQAVIAVRTGQPLPPGAAYDKTGAPTRDPAAALSGAFMSWGGHRGSGLGMVIQLLGVLAGSPILPGQLHDFGFFVLAIRPDLFVEPDEFRANVSEYARQVRASRPVNEASPVRVPFERSAALRAQRITTGWIDVDATVYAAVRALADSPPPDPRTFTDR